MTEFLTQGAWAERMGVSVSTFRRWRQAGFIPIPADLPGHPRWSLAVVNRITPQLPVVTRGLVQRRFQSRPSKSQHAKGTLHASALSRQLRSDVHAASVADAANAAQVNSVEGQR
jgi:hypothetical protein